ncbi:MAG: hypothetical protein V3T84_02400 [Phycisphaerales bacterium]
MAFGSGGDWNGSSNAAGTETVMWETTFDGPPASVSFPITQGQSEDIVAVNLMNAWNASYPNQATIDRNDPSTVRFDKNGQPPTAMAVTGTSGRKPLPENGSAQPVVKGLTVKNVS